MEKKESGLFFTSFALSRTLSLLAFRPLFFSRPASARDRGARIGRNRTENNNNKKKLSFPHLSVGQEQPVQRHEHGLPDDLADVPRGRGHTRGRGGAPLDPKLGKPEGDGAA